MRLATSSEEDSRCDSPSAEAPDTLEHSDDESAVQASDDNSAVQASDDDSVVKASDDSAVKASVRACVVMVDSFVPHGMEQVMVRMLQELNKTYSTIPGVERRTHGDLYKAYDVLRTRSITFVKII